VYGSFRLVAATPSPRAVLPELIAATDFLSSIAHSCPRLVYWHTTSHLFCDVIKHGSSSLGQHHRCQNFWREVAAAQLIPVWSPAARSDIAFADHAFSLSLSTDRVSLFCFNQKDAKRSEKDAKTNSKQARGSSVADPG
jgi:hypothetical protein